MLGLLTMPDPILLQLDGYLSAYLLQQPAAWKRRDGAVRFKGTTMIIDLQADAETIYNYLQERIDEYPEYINAGPGEDEDPISLITFGYQADQAGWVALVFDTRPDASPDGEWNAFIEDNWLEFPEWQEAIEMLYDDDTPEPIDLVLPDGSKQRVTQDDEGLSEAIGEMLKNLLIQARKAKLFADLPLAENCIMGVEDHDGAYGWPEWEKRHKDGKVV